MIAKSLGIVFVSASIAVLLAISVCSPATEEVAGPARSSEAGFTAAAAMVLVEERRLDLDVPIKTYIPEAPAMWDATTLMLTPILGPTYADSES